MGKKNIFPLWKNVHKRYLTTKVGAVPVITFSEKICLLFLPSVENYWLCLATALGSISVPFRYIPENRMANRRYKIKSLT